MTTDIYTPPTATVTASRAERSRVRRWPRLSVRRRMMAFGVVALLLNLIVVQSALVGLHRVSSAHRAVAQITAAQRYHQDADMMHDALHSDVLRVVLATLGLKDPAEALAGTRKDAAQFRRDIEQAGRLGIAGDVEKALSGVRGRQEAYIDRALRIAEGEGTTPPALTRKRGIAFESDFTSLEQPQAAVTSELAEESRLIKARADRTERGAERRIVLASLLSALGLLGLTLMLRRFGEGLAGAVTHERAVAETLQRSLLPERLPQLPGLAFAARYLPGGAGAEVGGDWFDVIALPGGEVGLVMGDIVGHDVRAASLMGQLRNALRAYALQGLPPGDVLRRLNGLMEQFDPGEMATCAYAVYDPVASTVLLANAGHPPPLVVEPSGRASYLDLEPCPPVGVLPDPDYTEGLYHVVPGSTIVLFTDGLVERRGCPLDQGLTKLQISATNGPADLEALCDHLLDTFFADEEPADDVAMLVIATRPQLGERLHLQLPAEPAQLGPLRRTLMRWLREAGAQPDEAYEITVSAGEAASNAIEHAYGPMPATFTVHGTVTGPDVDITIADSGHWRAPRGTDRGRGLGLIKSLMDEATVTSSETGTRVWMRRRLLRPTVHDVTGARP